jgi:hypothetical protein
VIGQGEEDGGTTACLLIGVCAIRCVDTPPLRGFSVSCHRDYDVETSARTRVSTDGGSMRGVRQRRRSMAFVVKSGGGMTPFIGLGKVR